MIVLFGSKVFKKSLGHSKELIHCEECKYSTHWAYLRCRTWFTLYYIPLIPYSSKKVFCCPECGYGIKVNQYNEHRIMPLIHWQE